jgi:hypothetical protein
MEAVFITKDSELLLSGDRVRSKRLVEAPNDYWFHSLILLSALALYRINEVRNGEYWKWIVLVAILSWASPHLWRIYRYLFVLTWRSSIPLNAIRSVAQEELNKLETKVTLTLHSGRKKEYIFRTSENEAERFVQAMQASIGTLAVG